MTLLITDEFFSWVVDNMADCYMGPVAPPTADGAPIELFFVWWIELHRQLNLVAFSLLKSAAATTSSQTWWKKHFLLISGWQKKSFLKDFWPKRNFWGFGCFWFCCCFLTGDSKNRFLRKDDWTERKKCWFSFFASYDG